MFNYTLSTKNVGAFFRKVGMSHPKGRNVLNAPYITLQF